MSRRPGTAAALEIVFGLFLHTFGIGWMYAGKVGMGIFIMLSWWVVVFINYLLLHVLIGFVTWPLCLLFAMIVTPILASRAARYEPLAA